MLQKKVTYKNYNDEEITETLYFNLSRAEIAEMELSIPGGLSDQLTKMVEKKDGAQIMAMFKDLILRSYGEKSPDGRRFIKSKEMSEAFCQTPAYDMIFMELVMNPEAAAAFVNQIVPQAQK
jgi:hypothetical protein